MFAPPPPGWTLVTDSVETAWVEQYGNAYFVRDVARPALALPPGFPAYTAVLHRLHINGVGAADGYTMGMPILGRRWNRSRRTASGIIGLSLMFR